LCRSLHGVFRLLSEVDKSWTTIEALITRDVHSIYEGWAESGGKILFGNPDLEKPRFRISGAADEAYFSNLAGLDYGDNLGSVQSIRSMAA